MQIRYVYLLPQVKHFLKNTNCSVSEALKRAKYVADEAISKGLKVRGYISTVITCPYEGGNFSIEVAKLSEELIKWDVMKYLR